MSFLFNQKNSIANNHDNSIGLCEIFIRDFDSDDNNRSYKNIARGLKFNFPPCIICRDDFLCITLGH